VAAVLAAKVAVAFPGNATAAQQLTQLFRERGVIECSKVLDVTGVTERRPEYGIPAAAALPNAMVPGPYQFKLSAPGGAKAVRVSGASVNPNLFGAAPPVTALVKLDAPITFTRTGAALTNDALTTGTLPAGSGSVSVDAGCGSTVYVSLGDLGGDVMVQNVLVQLEPLAACPVDAGVTTVTVPAIGTIEGTPAAGCGCSAFDASFALAALGLLGLRRRRG
jgi:hypothetical protein